MEDKLDILGIYDSGSNVSLINSKLLRLKKQGHNVYKNANLITINGVKNTKGFTIIKIKIFNIEKQIGVYVVEGENFKYDFLIGLDIIKEFKLIQDENLEITQKPQEKKTEGGQHFENYMKTSTNKEDLNIVNFNEHVKDEEFNMDLSHLNNEQKSDINKLISKYKSSFAKDKYDIGTVKNYEAHIDLLVDTYCHKRPYRCSLEDKLEIEEQVSKLLERDLSENFQRNFQFKGGRCKGNNGYMLRR